MSKKNNLSIRKRQHEFDKQREREADEKRKKTEEKRKQKEAALAATAAGVAKKQKRKGIRIRKNVVVKGIKVTDADSKKKVKKLLKAEAAMKIMEVEEQSAGEEGDAAMMDG